MNQETKASTSQLPLRLITAAVLIGGISLILGLANFDSRFRFVFAIFAVCAVALCAFELFRLGFGASRRLVNWVVLLGVVAPSIFSLLMVSGKDLPTSLGEAGRLTELSILVWYVATMLISFVSAISVRQNLVEVDSVFRHVMTSSVLVGLGGGTLTALTLWPNSAQVILYLILVVSLNDTAAYFAGIKVGIGRSAPIVSPRKTWTGHIAGLIAGVATAVAFSGLLPLAECPFGAAVLGFGITLAAQAGDLLKSYYKRARDVKDTGNILPGHGGLLDRIDGVLGGAPVLALWLLVFGHVA